MDGTLQTMCVPLDMPCYAALGGRGIGPGQRRALSPHGTDAPQPTPSRDAPAVYVGSYGLVGAAVSVGIGFWLIIRWAYGVFAHIIHVPVFDGVVDSPVVFGSKGQMIM